jgi:hypothetical protein
MMRCSEAGHRAPGASVLSRAGSLGRSARVSGGFEQKETERTKGAACFFVSFVFFCGFAALFHGRPRISFAVFRVFRGYISGAVEWPAVAANAEHF